MYYTPEIGMGVFLESEESLPEDAFSDNSLRLLNKNFTSSLKISIRQNI